MYNVICYKTRKPIIYNQGTAWETTCDEFLACYTNMNKEDCENYVARINAGQVDCLPNGQKVDIEKNTYFASQQARF